MSGNHSGLVHIWERKEKQDPVLNPERSIKLTSDASTFENARCKINSNQKNIMRSRKGHNDGLLFTVRDFVLYVGKLLLEQFMQKWQGRVTGDLGSLDAPHPPHPPSRSSLKGDCGVWSWVRKAPGYDLDLPWGSDPPCILKWELGLRRTESAGANLWREVMTLLCEKRWWIP